MEWIANPMSVSPNLTIPSRLVRNSMRPTNIDRTVARESTNHYCE